MLQQLSFASFWQALGLKRDDTFSVTMLGHCIEMYIGDTDAYIGQTSYMGKTTLQHMLEHLYKQNKK